MNKKIITSDQAPAPIGPYSQAVEAGDFIYLSGQIPIDPATGKLVTGDPHAETYLVMNNIGAVLKAAGLDYSSITKTSIFLKDMDDFAKINEIYGSYFSSHFPARETVQVARLPKDVSVEISVVAYRG